jgi:hypothetical protein
MDADGKDQPVRKLGGVAHDVEMSVGDRIE